MSKSNFPCKYLRTIILSHRCCLPSASLHSLSNTGAMHPDSSHVQPGLGTEEVVIHTSELSVMSGKNQDIYFIRIILACSVVIDKYDTVKALVFIDLIGCSLIRSSSSSILAKKTEIACPSVSKSGRGDDGLKIKKESKYSYFLVSINACLVPMCLIVHDNDCLRIRLDELLSVLLPVGSAQYRDLTRQSACFIFVPTADGWRGKGDSGRDVLQGDRLAV